MKGRKLMNKSKLANWQLAEMLVAEKIGGTVISPPEFDSDGNLLPSGGSYKKHDILMPDGRLVAVKYLPKQFKASSAIYTNIADKRDSKDVDIYINVKQGLDNAIQCLVKQEYIPCYTSGRKAPTASDRCNAYMAVTDLHTAIYLFDLSKPLQFEARLIDRTIRRKYQKLPAATIALYKVLSKPDKIIEL